MRFGALVLTALLTVLSVPAWASTLTIDANGVPLGATGVNVGGNLLDVTFVEGSCISLKLIRSLAAAVRRGAAPARSGAGSSCY
jgi:hypothetical protein